MRHRSPYFEARALATSGQLQVRWHDWLGRTPAPISPAISWATPKPKHVGWGFRSTKQREALSVVFGIRRDIIKLFGGCAALVTN